MLNSPAKNTAAVEDYLRDGTGPLASTGGEVVCKSLTPNDYLTKAYTDCDVQRGRRHLIDWLQIRPQQH